MKLNFLNIITFTFVLVLFSCRSKHYEQNPFEFYNEAWGGMSVATAERKFGEINFYSGMRINDILHILGNPSNQFTDSTSSTTYVNYSAGDPSYDPIEAEDSRRLSNYAITQLDRINPNAGIKERHYETKPRGGPREVRSITLELQFIKNKLVSATTDKIDRGNISRKVLFKDTMALQDNFRTQSKARGLSDEDVNHALELGKVDKLYRSGQISRQEMIKRCTAINKKYFSVE